MSEPVKRYALPLCNGRVLVPQEVDQGYWVAFADYDRDIKALEAARETDKVLMDGMQKECADAHNLAAKQVGEIEALKQLLWDIRSLRMLPPETEEEIDDAIDPSTEKAQP